MLSQLASAATYGVSAFLAAYAALAFLTRRHSIRDQGPQVDTTLVFLLRDGILADANFQARRILNRVTGAETEIDKLRLYLSSEFEDVADLTALPSDQPDMSAQSKDGRTQLSRRVVSDAVRLTLRDIAETAPASDDIHTLRAIENELETLRANTTAAPFLLWRQNDAGEITWANKSYMDAVKTTCDPGRATVWPLPALFPSMKTEGLGAGEARRIAINTQSETKEAWFDCHVAAIGKDILCTAIPADEAVRSEKRRREFTQTLTKTFAELAIGLAIFDRQRRLVLFNPALLDLTNLPTDFLTSRPTLVSFLDQLREGRVMPEPRDYRTWRNSIAELEAAAADGTYSETWSLPDGQTYHVTGRPHPDGAVALLFEDISAEMSLTRRFRSELEESHTVIDAFDDAVATFSPAGRLTLSNRAYRELWRTDPDEGLVGVGLTDATRQWHAMCNPTPVWGDFREFAQSTEDREEWSANVSLNDGRSLFCRFIPQKAGSTMVIFRIQTALPLQARDEFRHAV